MRGLPDQYISLICSLPTLGRLFSVKQAPLSRLKLEQRLRVLNDKDQSTLRLVENALNWNMLPMSTLEEDVISRGKEALNKVESSTLKKIILNRLELRTCIAALRRRNRGEKAAPNESWGIGRWVHHITINWTNPNFRLENVFPWIVEADRFIQNGDANGLEHLVLEQSYKQLQRMKGSHIFDIEAVIIYVLKWNIVDRVARYNTESANRRFQDLVHASLGEYENMTFSRPLDGES